MELRIIRFFKIKSRKYLEIEWIFRDFVIGNQIILVG